MLWFKSYVFVLPDGGHLGFMGQNDVIAATNVGIGILGDEFPKRVSLYVIFGALVQ